MLVAIMFLDWFIFAALSWRIILIFSGWKISSENKFLFIKWENTLRKFAKFGKNFKFGPENEKWFWRSKILFNDLLFIQVFKIENPPMLILFRI